MNSKYKRIDETEIVIGSEIALFISVACFCLDLLGIGIFISPIIESFFVMWMWWFFRNHGDPHASKLGVNITQYLSTAIPFVPSILIIFITRVVIHNRQGAGGVVGKVASATAKS